MSDREGDVSATESCSTVRHEVKQPTEVPKPLNVQRALSMRNIMSDEELVHKPRQYYPSLQKIKEKKVASYLNCIVYKLFELRIYIHYRDWKFKTMILYEDHLAKEV
jgi:hypothetical protein